MGRLESPLDRDGSPVRDLAVRLRALRKQSGLTYEQLARRTRYGKSTLQEAAAGRRLPTLNVTLAMVTACGGDAEAWRSYWTQVRAALASAAPGEGAAEADRRWEDAPGAEEGKPGSMAEARPGAFVQPALVPRRRSRPSLAWGAAVVALAVGVSLWAGLSTKAGVPPGTQARRHSGTASRQVARRAATSQAEEEYNKKGAATFQYLDGSGPGQPIEFREFVNVSCKVHNTTLASTRPDGYWYRIASMPWDNKYYAVANTFLNGDPPGGPYTHNTDFGVPDC